MNELIPLPSPALPSPPWSAAIVRNPHTWRAYSRAVAQYLMWCEFAGVLPFARPASPPI
jgi:hypothetical protein